MSLRFIVGRAGTGKTHTCLEEARARLRAAPHGAPLLLLVPEQATFQMEQALVHTPELGGIQRAQVLSFRRLAYRVFLELGGAARPAIGDLGKRMVLRALVAQRAPELRLFGRQAGNAGFIERLAASLTELRTYRRSVTDLQAEREALAAAGLEDSPLWAKLHDLGVILSDFDGYLEGRFTDPDDYLHLLADRVEASRLVQGAEIWVDGFTGFTPQELAVLAGILRVAHGIHVTVCADPADLPAPAGPPPDSTHLFHPTLDTYIRLRRLAAALGVPVAPPTALDLPHRFRNAPALAHIEREALRPVGVPYAGGPVPVALGSYPDRRAEVEAAGREVRRLCRQADHRFRDIAVIVRDLDLYGDLIATVFGALDIPHFLDRRRPISHHPAVELVRSALEAVTSHWAYEPVFRYLKTDLVPLDRAAVDQLENYVLEHGIRGRRWYEPEPWNFIRRYTLEEDAAASDDSAARLAALNAARHQAVAALARFHGQVRGRPSVRTLAGALYELLAELGVPERLQQWSEAAVNAGDLDAAQEHRQVWSGLVDLLDQMVDSLGSERLTAAEGLQVLEAGLEALRPATIPPGLDQVLVGAIERSRHPNVRTVLILGANDGAFPPAPAEDVVFTDRERETLAAAGFELGPTSRTRLFHEQYLTYLTLTRASERLWISAAAADEAGRALAPSPVLGRLTQLLPGVTALPGPGDEGLGAVTTPRQLAATLAQRLRQGRSGAPLGAEWLSVYAWVQGDADLRRTAAPVLAALDYRNDVERLPPGVVTGLYGDILRTSVSRLESFAACPFQHFAAYGLGLQERMEYRLEAPHLGQFFHAGLSLFVGELRRRGLDWGSLEPEQITALATDIAGNLAPRLHSEILLSSGRYRYTLRVLRRTLNTALQNLAEHARRGEFRPVAVELDFGGEGQLPPWRMELGAGTVEVRGRIDRIDAAFGADGRCYVRVLDYKSSPRKLDVRDVYYGLALQLTLYLLVTLRNGAGLVTAAADRPPALGHGGMLYYPVYDPPLRTVGPLAPEQAAEQRRRQQFRMSGLLCDDVDVLRLMDRELRGDLIPATVRQDGTLSRQSRVAADHEWAALFAHVRQEVAGLSTGILTGDVAVAPYRIGTERPCRHCAYRCVCRFDPLVEGNHYRQLPPLAPDEVWRRLQVKAAEGGEG